MCVFDQSQENCYRETDLKGQNSNDFNKNE